MLRVLTYGTSLVVVSNQSLPTKMSRLPTFIDLYGSSNILTACAANHQLFCNCTLNTLSANICLA